MKNCIKIFLFCATAFSFIGCDRVTKDLAKENLMDKGTLSYFHDTFRLEYVENTGAAMSLGDNLPESVSFWLLSIFPLAILLIIFFYTIRNIKKMSLPKIFSLSLIVAGGLGNIIDRLLFNRHVTDFMNLGIHNLRTGIFNFADVCVTAGSIGLLFFYRDKKQNLVTEKV